MRIENEAKTLDDLMTACQHQAERKADYVVPSTTELVCRTVSTRAGNRTQVVLEGHRGEPTKVLEANPTAFEQLCSKAGIDIRTGRRFQEHYSNVLDLALNSIHENEPRTAMLRTFDVPRGHILNLDSTVRREFADGSSIEAASSTGMLRAVVTDRFKTFDHPDLLGAVLPVLIESDADWQIVNAAITDRRLYARFKSRTITGVGAAVGDAMAQGIVISNSETGHGSISIAQIVWTLICLNGMETTNKTRSTHLTSARAEAAELYALLSDESKRLDNAALKSKLVDYAAAFASREMFEEVLEQMRAAAGDHVKNGIAAAQPAVEALGGVLKLTKAETSSVFAGLLATVQQDGYRGEPLSRATLVNAVTAAAKTAQPDDVSDWHKRGGKVLDLPRHQWQSIAEVPLAIAA